MQFKPETVFLFSGQMSRSLPAARRTKGPLLEQRVVVAPDEAAAYGLLAQKEPNFRPLGAASLKDYEDAAANVRAALNGTKNDWPLLFAIV